MSAMTVPTKADVTPDNQALFDTLEKKLGFVPNLYATLAYSPTALGTYLALQSAKSSITGKAREVLNLVTSQVNGCAYCLAAHTAISKSLGFTDAEILEVRGGRYAADAKLDALAQFTREVVTARGHASVAGRDAFLAAGWSAANLVDALVAIGEKTVTNYVHAATQVPVDFPAAPKLGHDAAPTLAVAA